MKRPGCSIEGRCATSGQSTRRAPGMPRATRSAASRLVSRSCCPTTTRAGARTSPSRSSGGGSSSTSSRSPSPLTHLEGPALHPAHRHGDCWVDVGRVAVRAHDPGVDVGLDRGVEVTRVECRRLRIDEGSQVRGHRGEEAAAGRREEERRHAVDGGQGELDRHTSAHGGPDDVAALDAESVEQRQQVGDVVERAPGSRRGIAEAPQVRPDDVEAGRERRPLGVPHPPVGDPRVDEEHRWAPWVAPAVVSDPRRRRRHARPLVDPRARPGTLARPGAGGQRVTGCPASGGATQQMTQ